MANLRTPLQANQLLAGLQQREPKMYDLFRSLIGDIENITGDVNQNTQAIASGGVIPGESGLTHGQVMKRISIRI